MRRHQAPRNPLFRRRRFSDDVIILCVRWYLRFKLSYREMAEIAWELGVLVAPSTILRWVVRYAADFSQLWSQFERPVGRSWRCDETYIKVGRQWMYLYRAVDERGRTVESYLSRTRDITAAKAFFRKALKHHGQPRTITLDGFEPSHSALRRMGMNNEFNYRWENPVKIRCCPYLNNVVEQDHCRIKFRVQPMLGFKAFYNARRVLIGIELLHKIIKGQFRVPAHFRESRIMNTRAVPATEPRFGFVANSGSWKGASANFRIC
jgi:transposase-like protein